MNDQIFLFPDNAGATSLWLGGGVPYSWSNIYFNGTAGIDLTEWFTKGGATGTLKRKQWQYVNPTDVVIVVEGGAYDTGGGP